MKHLLDLLKRAGLTEKESSIYLAILSLGFPRISNLAKEVDIPRTSIYIHINNLARKGFVKKSKKKGVEHVSAIEPEDIIKQTERDIENMRSALPDFERLINTQAKKPDVGFFDTAEGIQRFYDSLGDVKKNEFIYCAESGDTLNYYFQKFGWNNMRQVQKKLAERNIPVKGILTEDALPIIKQMPPDIVGVIDKRIIFPKLMDKEDLRLFIDFYLLPPNKIFFLMTQENLIIEIKNISLYKSLESIFLYLHARGKPINLSETLKSKD